MTQNRKTKLTSAFRLIGWTLAWSIALTLCMLVGLAIVARGFEPDAFATLPPLSVCLQDAGLQTILSLFFFMSFGFALAAGLHHHPGRHFLAWIFVCAVLVNGALTLLWAPFSAIVFWRGVALTFLAYGILQIRNRLKAGKTEVAK